MLTLKKAAEEVGLTKQGLQQAIKKGTISANKNIRGEYEIDPVELFRVYTPVNKVDNNKSPPIDSSLHPSLHLKIRELEIESNAKDKEILIYKERIGELKEDKENWQNQAQTLLIEHKQYKNLSQERFNTSSGSHGTENKNNALLGSLLLIMMLVLTSWLTYTTKSFWMPYLKSIEETQQQATEDKS